MQGYCPIGNVYLFKNTLSRPYPSRSFSREPLHRRNGKIRAREVRVFQMVDKVKQQLGVMSLHDALRLATSQNLDLIEVAPGATPPVCLIGEYGKFLYDEVKRTKDTGRSSAGKMKEVQISAAIDPHDLGVKLDKVIGFLNEDMKVRIKLRFKGRQRAHKEFGYQVMNKLIEGAAAYGHPDTPPKALGDRDLSAIISPLPRNKRPKAPTPSETPETPEAPPPVKPPDEPQAS